MNMHSRRRVIVCWILLGVGILSLVYAIYEYGRVAGAMHTARYTRGTVVDVSDGAYEGTEAVIVEFDAANDKTVQIGEDVESGTYTKGEQVPVVYQLGYPQFGGIYHFFPIWRTAIIAGATGLLFMVVAMTLWARGRKSR